MILLNQPKPWLLRHVLVLFIVVLFIVFHSAPVAAQLVRSAAIVEPPAAGASNADEEDDPLENSPSRLSDEPIPLQIGAVPERTPPIIEFGNPFLGTGTISRGFQIPTGAVWNPAVQIYGTARTALQVVDDGVNRRRSEWANRVDLVGNLQLTPTERILISFRPLDDGTDFTGYVFRPDSEDGWQEDLDTEVDQFFFEGDFGELFPGLDDGDEKPLDIGFAVGRQLLTLQGGYLARDVVDAAGVTRNNLRPFGFSNLRLTGRVAWEDLHRGRNAEDDSATMITLETEADVGPTTVIADVAWTISSDSAADSIHCGVSAVRRFGSLGATVRLLASLPTRDDTVHVSTGLLPVVELAWTPHGGNDLVYLNSFWGIDEFTSAVRAPDAGGALSPIGLLFEAPGIGRVGAALDGDTDSVVGGALGYQMFLGSTRRQLILEVGGRVSTDSDTDDDGQVGLAARFQQALGQRILLQPNVFGFAQDGEGPGWGARLELLMKF